MRLIPTAAGATVAAIALAAPLALLAAPASAASTVHLNLQTEAEHLTGDLTFTGSLTFKGTNMRLCDEASDNHGAQFRFVTNNGAYDWHSLPSGKSCYTWDKTFYGTDPVVLKWARVDVREHNDTSNIEYHQGAQHKNPYA